MSDPNEAARQGSSGWWQCVTVGADGAHTHFTLVSSDRHPDGARVELGALDAAGQVGADALCVASYGDLRRVGQLLVKPRAAPKAPPLWFAEIRESTAQPPAVSLVAFTGHGTPPGALVDEADLANLPVRNEDQVGALRWYPGTGEVDQIYVQPEWRRRSIANALIAAGATLSRARDWPRLWGDGQRTVLGEQFRNHSEWRARAADLTHTSPPMTPGEA
jgi:GNAT superfamily N-acetyltransferase